MKLLLIVWLLVAGTPYESLADLSGTNRTEVAARVIKIAKACIEKSPDLYRSVWGSPLNFDQAEVQAQPDPDTMRVAIPEKTPKGKPQGVGILVNIKTRQCAKLTLE